MKIFLRVVGYSGLGLITLGYLSKSANVAVLGLALIAVAVIETIIKY